MAKFFVGQRVKLVRARTETGRMNLGCVATIVALGDDLLDKFNNPAEAFIDYDNGAKSAVMLWQIEPIQYDGMQPVEWSECLWQPEGISA